MANKTYKMIVPKAGAANELGTDTMLYAVDEIYEAELDWGVYDCPIGYCLHLMAMEKAS